MRKSNWVATFIGALIFLFALGISAQEKGAGAPAKRESLKLGWVKFVTTEWGIFVAPEKGFYEREGLDVQYVTFTRFEDLTAALTSGQVDVISGAYTTPIFARVERVPMKLIMAGHNTRDGYNNWYATLPNSKINSVKDLEGKTAQIFLKGSFAWTIATYHMTRHGVDLNKVNLIGLPFPESYAALKTGRADVATFIEPFFSLANKASREEFGAPLKVLWTFEEAMGMDDIVLATPGIVMEETIKKKPEALRRYVHAIIKAQQWGWKEENWDEVKRLIVKWTGMPAGTAQIMMLAPGSLNGRFPIDPYTGVGQLQRTQEMLKATGALKIDRFFSDNELFDKQFLP